MAANGAAGDGKEVPAVTGDEEARWAGGGCKGCDCCWCCCCCCCWGKTPLLGSSDIGEGTWDKCKKNIRV